MTSGPVTSDVGRWAAVPEWLLDADVSPTAIRCYAVLLAKWADRDGRCWPSLSTLAAAMRCGKSTAQRAVAELQMIEALTIVSRTGTSNIFVVHIVPPAGRGVVIDDQGGQVVDDQGGYSPATPEPKSENQTQINQGKLLPSADRDGSKKRKPRRTEITDDWIEQMAAKYTGRHGAIKLSAAGVRDLVEEHLGSKVYGKWTDHQRAAENWIKTGIRILQQNAERDRNGGSNAPTRRRASSGYRV